MENQGAFASPNEAMVYSPSNYSQTVGPKLLMTGIHSEKVCSTSSGSQIVCGTQAKQKSSTNLRVSEAAGVHKKRLFFVCSGIPHDVMPEVMRLELRIIITDITDIVLSVMLVAS